MITCCEKSYGDGWRDAAIASMDVVAKRAGRQTPTHDEISAAIDDHVYAVSGHGEIWVEGIEDATRAVAELLHGEVRDEFPIGTRVRRYDRLTKLLYGAVGSVIVLIATGKVVVRWDERDPISGENHGLYSPEVLRKVADND